MRSIKMTVVALADWLVTQAPDGWAVTRGDGWTDGHEASLDTGWAVAAKWITYARGPATIALNIMPVADKWDRENAFRGCKVEGHTLVDGRTFTRRGIDVKSCGLASADKRYAHEYGSVLELLAGEEARCLKALERETTAKPVPGLPFTRQPDWFPATAATLRAGKTVTLTPHGFGTGYTLTTRRRSAYSTRLPELETQIGVTPIWAEQFDHD